jgi:hypothetical protein
VPALSLPPRFWVLLGAIFLALFAWRVARRWWVGYKQELRAGWDAVSQS